MFLVGIFSWWYGEGFVLRAKLFKDRLKSSADFFSIGLLLSTLFEPFRQISADRAGGSIKIQLQSFFDRLLSRFIGAFMRILMILVGIIVMFLQGLFGCLVMVFWLILPFLPVAGLIATLIGLAL